MPLHITHGASRRAAAPHPPPVTMVSPLLYLVTAVGVRGPTRWRLQEAIIMSIVPSPRLDLVLLLREGLRLWGRRRSASAQGFFIAASPVGPVTAGPVATSRRATPSTSPSARSLWHHHHLGQWDLPHESTIASRTTSRTSAPPARGVLVMVPCGDVPPRGAGGGLHLGSAGVLRGHAPPPMRSGAAGTASSTPSWCCTGRPRLSACPPTSTFQLDWHSVTPAWASSLRTALRSMIRRRARRRTRGRPKDAEEKGREERRK